MTRLRQYSDNNTQPQVIGFVCNWSAYSGVEIAGINQRIYPANLRLVKLMCLGRLNPGLVLKAFELGADGVVLLGCPSDDCHYESGMEKAKETFAQAKKLLRLLGIDQKRLALVEVPIGRDDILTRKVLSFVRSTSKTISSRKGRRIAKAILA
ncbi:hydrogenase iron-sulfur subunit [Chloroflexota bacterium]